MADDNTGYVPMPGDVVTVIDGVTRYTCRLPADTRGVVVVETVDGAWHLMESSTLALVDRAAENDFTVTLDIDPATAIEALRRAAASLESERLRDQPAVTVFALMDIVTNHVRLDEQDADGIASDFNDLIGGGWICPCGRPVDDHEDWPTCQAL